MGGLEAARLSLRQQGTDCGGVRERDAGQLGAGVADQV